MYLQLCKQRYEYIPVWVFQLGRELGKNDEKIAEEWYNLNVRIPPLYSLDEKEVRS